MLLVVSFYTEHLAFSLSFVGIFPILSSGCSEYVIWQCGFSSCILTPWVKIY